MRNFSALFAKLDSTNRSNEKLGALEHYFSEASPVDAAWALYFLSGQRIKQPVRTKNLRAWATQLAEIPEWLFDECYHTVGDLAETIALVLPPAALSDPPPLSRLVEEKLHALAALPEPEQREQVLQLWRSMDSRERMLFNKLITGGFRVGVSASLVVKALARVGKVAESVVAQRLAGKWIPSAAAFQRLFHEANGRTSEPYPFFLAYPMDFDPATLGTIEDWQAEWKWDGIRAQLVKRAGQICAWSRGGEVINSQFPEIAEAGGALPDGTVLDGEIMAWIDGAVAPFGALQRRLNRKMLSPRLREEVPAMFIAYDLLEHAGEDIRATSLRDRRQRLEAVVSALAGQRAIVSPLIIAESWDTLAKLRAESRGRRVEGIMLKARDSAYGTGRTRGQWWKWKIEPHTIDAVLVYAQPGSGKRASLFTDYTFAVWDDRELVPFAKAYSGLSDEEIREVDAFVRRNTLEKFGPVRRVKPLHVFELAFEAVQRSTRHKSGIAVRFPRIKRWRTDKTVAQADTLAAVRALISESIPA